MNSHALLEFEAGFGLQWGMDCMRLPCGGTAYYDEESTCHIYRCINCLTVVGSTGMPARCKDAVEQWEVHKSLGGSGWDYFEEAK